MFPVPTTLSPSRVDSFLKCQLAYRFANIDRLPEPPSPAATKGSLVHRVLELLFTLPAAQRTRAAGESCLETAIDEFRTDPDFTGLLLSDADSASFFADARVLVHRYFDLEDPAGVHPIGLELRLEATVGDVVLRGIIDRLELDRDGRLVVSDYKAAKAPPAAHQADRFNALHCYAYMCEQVLGQRPAAIRLLYLRSGDVVTATPTGPSMRSVQNRTTAVHRALATACTTGMFTTRRSPLCDYCNFKEWCPEFGGDPEAARVEAPRRMAGRTAA